MWGLLFAEIHSEKVSGVPRQPGAEGNVVKHRSVGKVLTDGKFGLYRRPALPLQPRAHAAEPVRNPPGWTVHARRGAGPGRPAGTSGAAGGPERGPPRPASRSAGAHSLTDTDPGPRGTVTTQCSPPPRGERSRARVCPGPAMAAPAPGARRRHGGRGVRRATSHVGGVRGVSPHTDSHTATGRPEGFETPGERRKPLPAPAWEGGSGGPRRPLRPRGGRAAQPPCPGSR